VKPAQAGFVAAGQSGAVLTAGSPVPSGPRPATAEEPVEEFPYGWRVVERQTPAGFWEPVYLPLTLEDVLHPEEEDQVTHADSHQRRLLYLYDAFEAQLAGDPTAVVLNDVRIAWDLPDLRPHGPDLMVILGVRERRNWSTFDVKTEGVRPALIVEMISPDTARIDQSDKLRHYDRAGVPLYIFVDTVAGPDGTELLRLFGFQRVRGRYQGLGPDERGRLWLPPVRLWLAVEEEELVCFDEHEQPILGFAAQVAARRAAEEAAVAAEERARALEEELRRLRGERGSNGVP
jgi:Uma2 family endonuclease